MINFVNITDITMSVLMYGNFREGHGFGSRWSQLSEPDFCVNSLQRRPIFWVKQPQGQKCRASPVFAGVESRERLVTVRKDLLFNRVLLIVLLW